MGNTAKKAAVKTQDLLDLVLTPEELAKGNVAESELFELEYRGNIIGPFWQDELIGHIFETEDFPIETKVRPFHNGSDENWVAIFDHPIFQRRGPQLLPSLPEEESESYMIIINGSPEGPFQVDDLKTMLKEKKILYTNVVSSDAGKTWTKIYETINFDRRTHEQEGLPPVPEDSMGNHLDAVGDWDDDTSPQLKVKEAMAGLAFLGNAKDGKIDNSKKLITLEEIGNKKIQNPSEVKVENNQQTGKPAKPKASFKWTKVHTKIIVVMVLLAGLIGGYIYQSGQKKKAVRTKAKTTVDGKKASPVYKSKVKRNVKPSNTSSSSSKRVRARSGRKELRDTVPKRARRDNKANSFRKSKAFRERQQRKAVAPPTNVRRPVDELETLDDYYNDESSPVEDDPIRSRLSKETIDPEFSDSELSEAEKEALLKEIEEEYYEDDIPEDY